MGSPDPISTVHRRSPVVVRASGRRGKKSCFAKPSRSPDMLQVNQNKTERSRAEDKNKTEARGTRQVGQEPVMGDLGDDLKKV